MVGRLIRWQTRSEYSHAALVFSRELLSHIDDLAPLQKQFEGGVEVNHELTHKLVTIEAREFRGVRLTEGVVKAIGANVDLFSVRGLGLDHLVLAWEFAKAQLGKDYDYTMVARFISRRQESRSTSDKWFCSELAFAAIRKAGIELLRGTEPWEVSPGLLARSPLLTLEKKIP